MSNKTPKKIETPQERWFMAQYQRKQKKRRTLAQYGVTHDGGEVTYSGELVTHGS